MKFKNKKRQLLVEDFPTDLTFDIVEKCFEDIKCEFNKKNQDIVFDFKYVTYIDSTGIGKLVQFEKYLNENSFRLFIINVTESVYRLLDFFKLENILNFTKDDSLLYEKEVSKPVYIISDDILDKNKISELLKKECIFIQYNKVDIKYLTKNIGNDHIIEEILKEKDASKVIKRCIDLSYNKKFNIIHDIIRTHKDTEVRKAVVLYSQNIKNDPLLISVLKNSYLYEDDADVKKTIKKVLNILS